MNRIDYLRAEVKRLLENNCSDAYIEATLYTGAYSMTEITTAIIDVKQMYDL
jgi:hypothetical protein